MDYTRKTLFMIIYAAITAALCCVAAAASVKPAIIKVTDYGVAPESKQNAVPAVNAALKAAGTKKSAVIVFPKGRYDFWPVKENEREYYLSNTDVVNPRRCAILIEGKKNITIDGRGSSFIFHDRILPVVVDRSTNITLKDFSIDWDIPLTAQAKVIKSSPKYIDITIDPVQYPYKLKNHWIVFQGEGWESPWQTTIEYDPKDRFIPPGTGDNTLGYYSTARVFLAYRNKDDSIRLTNFAQNTISNPPREGDMLILRHSARDHSGMFLYRSKDVRLLNIDIFHTAGLGVLGQYTENISADHVRLIPNYEKGRYFGGHDDGFHISNCKGLLKIENSEFAGLLDDPVNVHGTYVKIIEKKDKRTALARFIHHQSINLDFGWQGDTIGFSDNGTMLTVGTAKLKSVKHLSKTDMLVTFDRDIPAAVKPGFALENLTWTPSVEIRNCRFGNGRARGVLVSTPRRVVIENNRFESSGSAILIAGDNHEWFESGAARDVLIRNNNFADLCLTNMYQYTDGIISVFPMIPKSGESAPYHRNIRIEGNTFHPFDYPVLFARSVDGLTFKNNRIIRSSRFEPFHFRKATLNFEACRNVKISGTKFEGDVLGRNIAVEKMSPAEVKADPKDDWIR